MGAAGDGAGVSPRRVEGHVVVHPRNLHLLPKPGGPSPQEPGLDVQPASGSWFFFLPPPAPSVIMNYDLILARPHQHTGHCTPRHLDRQCHRTGPRWLLSASPAGNQFLLSAGPPPYWLTCALSATLHQG